MNTVGKTLAAGALFVTGYLVGFYEMKYKTLKVILESQLKEKNEEESQE